MIIKVFFENKTVFLTDVLTPYLKEFLLHPETIYIDEISSHAINTLQYEIDNSAIVRGILYDPNFEKIKKNFYKRFNIIKAAGGLVKNDKGEILFIFRRGKWDLPKGKMEDDEDAETTAVREVKEETGLQKIKLKKRICTTYHVYKEFGKNILKETDWFQMTTSSLENLTPQIEEGIEKIEWVNLNEVKIKLKNSYELIGDVLEKDGVDIL